MIKLKCAYQRFGLGYKPKKNDYKHASQIRKNVRMTKIKGREQEELVIPPLQTSFLRSIKMIRFNITYLYISTLKFQEKGQIEEANMEIKDEVLP